MVYLSESIQIPTGLQLGEADGILSTFDTPAKRLDFLRESGKDLFGLEAVVPLKIATIEDGIIGGLFGAGAEPSVTDLLRQHGDVTLSSLYGRVAFVPHVPVLNEIEHILQEKSETRGFITDWLGRYEAGLSAEVIRHELSSDSRSIIGWSKSPIVATYVMGRLWKRLAGEDQPVSEIHHGALRRIGHHITYYELGQTDVDLASDCQAVLEYPDRIMDDLFGEYIKKRLANPADLSAKAVADFVDNFPTYNVDKAAVFNEQVSELFNKHCWGFDAKHYARFLQAYGEHRGEPRFFQEAFYSQLGTYFRQGRESLGFVIQLQNFRKNVATDVTPHYPTLTAEDPEIEAMDLKARLAEWKLTVNDVREDVVLAFEEYLGVES